MSQGCQVHHKGTHRSNRPAPGNSQTADQWLGNLHGTGPDPLHMCEGCIAWSICGTPGHGSGPVSNALVVFIPVPNAGLPCQALIQREALNPILP